MSGLRVNLEKSELIPVGRVENVDELADEFGYRVGKLSSTYLGMSLGAPFKSVAAWDGTEERFRKKLAMWKRQYISKGGRITLVRSTLSNLPIYFMSIFQMPRVVRIRLEKIQRDFLWGGGALEQKPHLVRWSIVCLDKRSGGLGVKSLGPSIGLSLANGFGVLQMKERLFGTKSSEGNTGRKEEGGDLKVKFWKDKWCETIPLCEAFPSLFALASNKEAWVNEVWTVEGEWGEVGTLVSIDLSTIGSWKKWKGYFVAWRGRRLGGMRRIR
ncbi:putative ribonuclease H protein [Vitis vinifera]|uniref:Putative ribonuclease H protein n=1 Tax=Vitis vinifera TaxID=29760 RepID=A0A438IIT4_VITVI|nr:putative ribonuclease H protein [Vitis vinifera]